MYLVIDLGGTNTRVASSKNLKTIYKEEKFSSQNTVEKQRVLVSQAISKVSDGVLCCICLGVPGTIDRKAKKFIKLPNYPPLDGHSFEDLFDEKSKISNLVVENDATLAGLGEAVFGAGKEYEVVSYITISTGVGGSRIANKKIDPTKESSEPGHMVIDLDGRRDHAGILGGLEAYVSGTAFEEIYKVEPGECSDQKVWDEYALYLSAGLLNILAMWNPDVIVIGGGMSNKFDKFSEPLLKNLNEQSFFEIPPIVTAQLGDDSGLFGGFARLTQEVE